jgi:hypothetical protein
MGTTLDQEFVRTILSRDPLRPEDMRTLVREIERLEAEVEKLENQGAQLAAGSCVHPEHLKCNREGVFCSLKEPDRLGYGEKP